MIESHRLIYNYAVDGKTYPSLSKKEKVALHAQVISEFPVHNFISEIDDIAVQDQLLDKLIKYLLAWDESEAIKKERRIEFEKCLELTVIELHKEKIEELFEIMEACVREAANDVDNQDVDEDVDFY